MSFVNLIVSVPNEIKLFRLYSLSVVLNLNNDASLINLLPHDYGFILACIVNGVIYEVIYNLGYFNLIGPDGYVAVVVKNELKTFLSREF